MSDYETITLSNNSASPTEMQYDGFLSLTKQTSNIGLEVFINGTKIVALNTAYTDTATLPINKGDKAYYTGPMQASFAQFYKKRDYSNR